MKFEKFNLELTLHNAVGYHQIFKLKDKNLVFNNAAYFIFLIEIGYGNFFDGNLIIIEPSSSKFMEILEIFNSYDIKNLIPVAFDGSTEGVYCIENSEDSKVFWFNWGEGKKYVKSKDFFSWIEEMPSKLFDKETYKAFKSIKDLNKINFIINERKKFDVQFISFEKRLSNSPSQSDMLFLKRYNKVIVKITKNEDTDLNYLTIKFLRECSKMGPNNLQFLSLQIANLKKGESKTFEEFLFDPFNLPFDSIILLHTSEIDLKSPLRVRYKEIIDFI